MSSEIQNPECRSRACGTTSFSAPTHPGHRGRTKVGKRGLEGVREAARKDGKLKFVSLLHHADVDALRRSFYKLKKTAAVGIDGVTWQECHEWGRVSHFNISRSRVLIPHPRSVPARLRFARCWAGRCRVAREGRPSSLSLSGVAFGCAGMNCRGKLEFGDADGFADAGERVFGDEVVLGRKSLPRRRRGREEPHGFQDSRAAESALMAASISS